MAKAGPLPILLIVVLWQFFRSMLSLPPCLQSSMTTKIILVATRPELLPIAQQIYLQPEFQLLFCPTLADAVRALEQDIDLIACGAHFGDGEMYDFLRLAKAHRKAKTVPFLVVDSGSVELQSYLHQSVEIAAKALGAAAVVPISKWRREIGDPAAFERYRQTMRTLLNA